MSVANPAIKLLWRQSHGGTRAKVIRIQHLGTMNAKFVPIYSVDSEIFKNIT